MLSVHEHEVDRRTSPAVKQRCRMAFVDRYVQVAVAAEEQREAALPYPSLRTSYKRPRQRGMSLLTGHYGSPIALRYCLLIPIGPEFPTIAGCH